MFSLFILFVLSTTACLGEFSTSRQTESIDIDEHILCRGCGAEISAANYLSVIASPHARQAINKTMFNRQVYVQYFMQVVGDKALDTDYPIITATHANCISHLLPWKEHNSLFPGYRWKVCICPSCGEFMGFAYDPISTETPSSAKSFYGLALPNVIGESHLDSFTKRPLYQRT